MNDMIKQMQEKNDKRERVLKAELAKKDEQLASL